MTISSWAMRLVLSGNRGIVPDDDLDLLAGDRVAVLRLVKLDRRGFLLAGGLLLAGHRQNEADFDRVFGECRVGRRQAERGGGGEESSYATWFPPKTRRFWQPVEVA